MSTRPPALLAAASLDKPHLFSTHVHENSYILALASTPTPTYAALAANLPEMRHNIHLYSPSPNGLAQTLTLPINHTCVPSAMRFVRNFCGRPTLLSSHRQPGCINVWDKRKGTSPVLEIRSPKNRAILSFDVSSDGHALAAGTDLQSDDASIFYWDPRNPAQVLHTHSSTHSDDITALHFHPTLPSLLLSASTDGLLCTSEAREADEDEAVREVANWGCSIARAGWFAHADGHGVWAASDMETFGLWNGDLDALVDFGDIRQPSLPGQWTTDYTIDASDFSGTLGPCGIRGLAVFLGSNSGDVAVVSISDISDHQPTWTIQGVLRGGHPDAVVRSVLWDGDNNVLLTGDEAGRLVAWHCTAETVENDVEMSAPESRAEVSMKRGLVDPPDQEYKRGRYES